MNANREAAIGRIRALLAKTVSNGCTESEAMAAAAKAAELMDKYAVTMTDAEVRQERCETRRATERTHDVQMVAGAIAAFCGCKVWKEGAAGIRFFGLPQDVEVAAYLVDLCRNAMDGAFRTYLKTDKPAGYNGRKLRKPFMVGMAARLRERLDEMTKAREATATTATGTALVLVRNAVVDEQFAAKGMKLRAARKTTYYDRGGAAGAGRAAGDKVTLTTGVKGGGAAGYLAA